MKGKSVPIIALLATLGVLTAGTGAELLELGPMPEQGVLLLRNGHSIEGKITRVGELYYIALPNGEIRIKAADVEFVCRNVEEGYHRKRAAIRPGDVRQHLQLAQWCLRQGLPGQAARELADAKQSDPRHPMIGLLQRRLSIAMAPPAKPAVSAEPAASASQPSAEDLQRLVRGMPPGTVETFTQQIQPVLINNCTAAGCHGPGTKSGFRLTRIPAGRPPSRLITQRNLHATLEWVDKREPAASRLLTAPIGPHGTAKTAIFTAGQLGQHQRLVDWVHRVAERPAAEVPVPVVSHEKPLVRAMPAESPGFHFSRPEDTPAADQQPALQPRVEDPFAKTFPVRPNTPGVEFVPVDPFDPEIFNRRYFPR